MFPVEHVEVVRRMGMQISDIALQERFGGYMRDIMVNLRTRAPWSTSMGYVVDRTCVISGSRRRIYGDYSHGGGEFGIGRRNYEAVG